ncbi:MAG: DUF6240 domain-containing protein [Lachnospiraceae bacterium]|nr:DUF6240 domain-containing protein [Lachnospiraceae bacterium]
MTVNINSNNYFSNVNKTKEQGVINDLDRFKKLAQTGQTIKGVITSITDKITLNFNGMDVNVPKESLKSPRLGEEREFQVESASEKGLALREVTPGKSSHSEDSTLTAKQGIISCTVVDGSAQDFIDMVKSNMPAGKDNSEDLKEQTDRITEEDYQKITEEGVSIESFEADRLKRTLDRIKENKEFVQDNVDRRIETKLETREETEVIAISNKLGGSVDKKLAKKLAKADLPVTETNIKLVAQAAGIHQMIPKLNDASKAYLIKNESELTVQNIYHSLYAGTGAKKPLNSEIKAELEQQLSDIIKEAGYAVTEETKEQGLWMIENDIPVSKESYDRLNSIELLLEENSEELVLDKIMTAMQEGKKPDEANLDIREEKVAQDVVRRFAQISDDAVETAVLNVISEQAEAVANGEGQGPGITENNIGSVISLNTLETAATQPVYTQQITTVTEIQIDIAVVTAKRQLEEIRLRMTVETAQKMAAKGIEFDTAGIERVVEALRETENEYYRNLLAEAGQTASVDKVTLLRNTTEVVRELYQAPAAILGSTLGNKSMESLQSLHQEGQNRKASYQRAEETYEALGTAPRKDMGDSIKKAFQNVDSLLELNGMELTDSNRRAVRILGYNSMEITEENITSMKEYDAQVNQILDDLQPSVTLELIKRDIDPLHMTMEQLESQISAIKEEIGISEEEKYSKYLWKLDKQGALTEAERKSYIGIYRLLNNVVKTDGAAIGAVVGAGEELTLKNLLSAVRTMRGSGIDQNVDDDFGGLTSLTFKRETITDQIYAAIHPDKLAYGKRLASQVLEEISPQRLAAVTEEGMSGLMDITLEKMKEAFMASVEAEQQHNEGELAYAREMLKDITGIMETAKEAESFLEAHNSAVTVANLEVAEAFFTGDRSLFKEFYQKMEAQGNSEEMAAFSSGLLDALEDADALKEQYDVMTDRLEEVLDREYENQVDNQSEQVNEISLLRNGIRLANRLSKSEHYEIPMVTGATITNVGLTIVSGTGETGKVAITVDSSAYGKVQCEFTVKEQVIKGFILCENVDGKNYLTQKNAQLEDGFKALGLDVRQINIATDQRGLEHYQPALERGENATSTKVLYQVAKLVVENIRSNEA